MTYGFVWLAAIVIFLLLEAVTYQLVCIWFAGGALAALISFGLKASPTVQIAVFFAVSIILLLLTRPALKRLINAKKVKTNVDLIPGSCGLVVESIDNLSEKGRVKVGGMEWAARSAGGEKIEKGTAVVVKEVSGVKLIVSI